MKKPVIHSARSVQKVRTVHQSLSLPIAWSSLGHLVFILLFIVLPKFTPEASVPSSIINVQLVAAPALQPASAPTVAPKEALQEEAAPIPEKKADVSTASKPKEAVSLAPEVIETKQSMKKKTYKRERMLESAIKSVEKRVEATKADPKEQALDKIRSELRDREAGAAAENSVPATGTAGINREGTPTSDIQLIYNAEVQYRIQQNWAFSDQLAGDGKNLYNLVAVTILRNGSIEDISFERRSGNSYFDDSTHKAIQKSDPLPRVPDGIRGASITLRFRFIPEGLK